MVNQSVEKRFEALMQSWASKTKFLSSLTAYKGTPEYRELLELGNGILPLVFRRLREDPHHCFMLLRELTQADPVPEAARGRVWEMAAIWEEWGRRNGYM